MSTLFESLKKLEEKKKQTTQAASKVFVMSGEKLNPGFSPNRLVISVTVFTVLFISFIAFTYFKHRELKAAISSERSGIDGQLKNLTNQVQGLTKSIDVTKQAVAKRLDSLAQELERQRDAQSKIAAQQTRLIEQNKSTPQAQIDEKFKLLSNRVSVLEESEQNHAPPQEKRVKVMI